MRKQKKVTLTVTVDSDLKEDLREQAKKEGRTLSNYVNFILKKMLNKE